MDAADPFSYRMEMDDSPDMAFARPVSPCRPTEHSACRGSESSMASASASRHVLSLDHQQQQLSCVYVKFSQFPITHSELGTRETAQGDCARHRFIVWAAVKRNSSRRMTPEERLECPLLRCVQRFPDHESMLQHLAKCQYLASGEYWCYDHMRIERFNDDKCRKCLDKQSRRRRMLTMAKHFFHSLGHKHKTKRGPQSHQCHDWGEPLLMVPPPSYDSLAWELGATEIHEADPNEQRSPGEAGPETAISVSDAAVVDPQNLLLLPELDSTRQSLTCNALSWPALEPSAADARSPVAKPTLQVNTRGLQGCRTAAQLAPPRPPRPAAPRPTKNLSPSSSVRSTASTGSNVTVASQTYSLISPVSNWSGSWSLGSGINTTLTSPVDLVSPVDFTTDTFQSTTSSLENNSATSKNYWDDIFELPADEPAAPTTIETDPLLMYLDLDQCAPSPTHMQPDPTSLDHVQGTADNMANPSGASLGMAPGSDMYCTETKTMIASAWDMLQEHLVHSMMQMELVAGNPLADQLRSMSTMAVATTGLQTLRALLHGGTLASAQEALCLAHLVHAFSLVLHEQGATARSRELFMQSLSYSLLVPAHEREWYKSLVFNIWRHPNVTQADLNHYLAAWGQSRRSNSKGKQPETWASVGNVHDAMLITAQNFLDELERNLILCQPLFTPEVHSSALSEKHLLDYRADTPRSQPFLAALTFVVVILQQEFADVVGLASKLNGVMQKVTHGAITSVRRAEIELIHAGKESMSASRFFDAFAPKVRQLCDPLYQEHDSGTSSRHDYHGLGISLIESVMAELQHPSSQAVVSAPGEHLHLDQIMQDLPVYSPVATSAAPTSLLSPTAGASFPFSVTVDPPAHDSSTEFLQLPVSPAPAEATATIDPYGAPNSTVPTTQEQNRGTTSPGSFPSSPSQPTDQTTQNDQQQQQGVEAGESCEICGYRPKGDPQWFKGSMAKHKKLQHRTDPPTIYQCPFPGCRSAYKNRPDNLRQHQIEKGHWVDGEEGPSRRPSKRRKRDAEGDGE